MNKRPLRLWTLNATENLLKPAEAAILGIFNGPFGPRRAVWADRTAYDAPSAAVDPEKKTGPSTNLMPDVEYFVPIAAKCIGQLFDDPAAGPALAAIRDYYERTIWRGSYQDYWREWRHRGRSGPTRMLTPDHLGYYEILRESAKDADNILIGYSQGGLVARYLAWLDEFLGGSAVSGIVTVAAPNLGSPLANPLNRDAVIDGLVRALCDLASMSDPAYQPIVDRLVAAVDFETVHELLLMAEDAVKADPKLTARTRGFARQFLRTARKWLSGLEPRTDGYRATAFTDLNLFTLDDPWSILGSVNRRPLRRVLHAAVVNADPAAIDMVKAAFPPWLDPLVAKLLGAIKWLDRPISPDNLDALSRRYRAEVMAENRPQGVPLSPDIQAALDELDEGRSQDPILEARAHDFIIPSAYQVLVPNQSSKASFLGCWVNPQSNHLSGSLAETAGGKRNIELIKQALRAMRDKGV
jgi:pimeloyl-ACP methyl ester carboxylesterase